MKNTAAKGPELRYRPLAQVYDEHLWEFLGTESPETDFKSITCEGDAHVTVVAEILTHFQTKVVVEQGPILDETIKKGETLIKLLESSKYCHIFG